MNPVDELNLLLGIGPSRPQLPLTLRKSGYVPVRSLGKGSYGQALLVFHEPQQQYFVVKHLNLAGMSSRQRHDAHNEINILQKLHHPNIVRYVEYYEEHPHLYIVMEYADGGDVYSLLSSAQNIRKMGGAAGGVGSGLYRGAAPPAASASAATATAGLLSEAQVVSLFVQTTMAVKYMHDRRLLHRDIKSSNIFLTKNHVVKLGDFGISTVLQSTVAMASTMCGTPCYFSPELCQGRPYNSKSDMWALGVLLYELCAGHVPFESTTMKALMRDIVHKQPPRIPGVYSTELWELIVQLLLKDARRRPDAGQVLLSPVLMKHVPDLINQLAEDPAQSASAATPTAAAAAAAAGSHAAPPASPSPPPPPPRRQVHSQVQEPASAAPAPPPAAAAAAARPPQPSPFVPPAAAAAAAAPLAPAGGAAAARQRGSPSAGAASIGALLARFDEEKQRIAEAKQQRRASQHEGSGGTGTGTGSDAGGAGSDGAPPRLSPGAAAALRQQGVQVPSGAEADTGAAGAAAGRVQRAPFMPPPLPAALRGSSAAGAAGGSDAAAAARPAAPTSPFARQRDSAAAAAEAADRPDSELRPAPSQEGRSEGGASRARPQLPAPQPPASNASSSAAAAAGGSATPAGPTEELNAMLSELSSWRERSVRRQQRHSDESGGGGGGGAARSAAAGAASRPQASSPQAAQPRRTSDGVAGEAPAPQPPPSPSAASPRPQLEKMSNGGGAAAAAAAARQPSPARGRSPAKTPASSPAAGADAARASTQSPAVPATQSPQKAVAPPPQQTPTRGAASTPATPGAAGSGKSPQPKQAKDAAPLSPTAVAPRTPATRGDASDMAAAAAAERSSSSSASGQSFVDALGTALDVDAIQAAAAAADAGRQAQASVGAGNASQLSGLGGPQQMTMKKTFQGTSQKIQSMQSTLMAGSVLRHVPSAGNAVGADGGDDDVEGAADVRFTTACLCGGATTSRGCLSMIYGSFICACDVCARLTGAPHGVEWLHLPELATGMPALLPPAPPRATGSGSPTAGTGAAAATALRAQSGGASASSSTTAKMATGAGSAEKSNGGRVTGNARASASASATASAARNEAAAAAAQLAQASIRAYEHHCSTALSTSLIAVSEGNAVVEVGAPGASQGRTSPTTSVSGGSAAMAVYVIYSCLTCGSLMGMQHDGVEGLLVPKLTLDAQSLAILSSCAQTVDLDASGMAEG